MPILPPPRPLRAWQILLIFIAGLAGLGFGLPAYFRALPVMESFGRLICRQLFGI